MEQEEAGWQENELFALAKTILVCWCNNKFNAYLKETLWHLWFLKKVNLSMVLCNLKTNILY